MLRCEARSATDVLGQPDDLKFRSCLTLFHAAASSPTDRKLFGLALQRFFAGAADPKTLTILAERRDATA